MTDKEKLHQILSSLWKNDDSVGKTYYNQALQDVQTAVDLQEEPVSEELEEAADSYIKTHGEILGFGRQTFKDGAKWQKKQMMAKAIDATCFALQGAALFTFRLPAGSYLVGLKVKVIVIKDD